MPFRIRFLDFPTRAPLDGLLAHYEPIAKGLLRARGGPERLPARRPQPGL